MPGASLPSEIKERRPPHPAVVADITAQPHVYFAGRLAKIVQLVEAIALVELDVQRQVVARHPRVFIGQIYIGRPAEARRGEDLDIAAPKIHRLEARPPGKAVLIGDLVAEKRQIGENLFDLYLQGHALSSGHGPHLQVGEDIEPVQPRPVLLGGGPGIGRPHLRNQFAPNDLGPGEARPFDADFHDRPAV